jgi:hypothetical protein
MDNPGSAEAVARGCTCDLIKNDFGRGNVGAFYCTDTCPVHGALLSIVSPMGAGLFTYENVIDSVTQA